MPDIDTHMHKVTALLIDMRDVIIRLNNCVKDAGDVLDRAAELLRAADQSEQKCPSCDGKGELLDLYDFRMVVCKLCKGTGISNRSAGG